MGQLLLESLKAGRYVYDVLQHRIVCERVKMAVNRRVTVVRRSNGGHGRAINATHLSPPDHVLRTESDRCRQLASTVNGADNVDYPATRTRPHSVCSFCNFHLNCRQTQHRHVTVGSVHSLRYH